MNAQDPCVVLLHGLWLNRWAMIVWRWRLRRAGFAVASFGYPSWRDDLHANAARLSEFIAALPAREIHLVAHSMGGVVAARALHDCPDARVRRVVMVGSPCQDSLAARRLMRCRFGRFLLGRSMMQWLQQSRRTAFPQQVEVGVIAGSLGIGLGRLLAKLPQPHDGVVAEQEAHVEAARDHLLLPVAHFGMLFARSVSAATVNFLRHGRFHP
ncbi:MAG: alpha/beta fold hydrolase [Pseudomonadota bacterium]